MFMDYLRAFDGKYKDDIDLCISATAQVLHKVSIEIL